MVKLIINTVTDLTKAFKTLINHDIYVPGVGRVGGLVMALDSRLGLAKTAA
jgi:hypothetical protein